MNDERFHRIEAIVVRSGMCLAVFFWAVMLLAGIILSFGPPL